MTEAKTAPAKTKAGVPAVYGSLHAVMEGLKNIPKNGKMKFGSTEYEYLRADDVQERINPLLLENNLIVRPEYTVDQINRGRGEGVPYVNVNLALTYISTLDGTEVTVHAVGESQASDDKSVNKGLTQAIKNAHRAQFQFASGEKEPDDLPPVERTQATAPKQVGPTVPALKGEIASLLKTRDASEIKAKGDEFFEGREGWTESVEALTKWRDALKKV